jgi:classical protein kinase C alpha type
MSDLIKYDTPHTAAKIQHMLQQLEFKLNVEQKYKEGMEKMAKLYQMEGDRRARLETTSKRDESAQKIVLLKQALKRYGNLDVSFADDEDLRDGPPLSLRKADLRRQCQRAEHASSPNGKTHHPRQRSKRR